MRLLGGLPAVGCNDSRDVPNAVVWLGAPSKASGLLQDWAFMSAALCDTNC